MASESQSRTALAYRNRVSSWFDQWLFFIVFVVGFGGIIVLKERGYEQLIVTAFPVAMMFVYALYVTKSQRYLLREDQVGDNLYYLGFLYTLISLSYSLFFFAGEEDSTQKIIGNFGVALATTIVGLALRVAFNQMRKDPVEIEREARLELGEAVSRLKAELDTSVIELNSFRRATTQSLAEGMAEISDKSNTILETHAARLTGLVEQEAKRLGEGFSILNENQQKFNAASRRTADAVDQLTQRVEAISVPSDLIERKLAPALEALTEGARKIAGSLAEGMAEISDKSNTILETHAARLTGLVEQEAKSLGEGFSILNENQQKFNAASRRTADAVDQLTQRVEAISVPSDLIERKLAPALEALTEGARKIAGSSHAQAENTEKLTTLIENAVESSRLLDQRLAALVKESEDQRQGLASEIEGLRGALGSLRGAARDLLEDLKDGAGGQQAILTSLTGSAEEHLKIAETHRNGLEEELKKSRMLVSEVHEALVSMTRLIIDKLDGH